MSEDRGQGRKEWSPPQFKPRERPAPPPPAVSPLQPRVVKRERTGPRPVEVDPFDVAPAAPTLTPVAVEEPEDHGVAPEPAHASTPEPEWRTNPARPNPVPAVINPTRQDDPPAAPEAPAASPEPEAPAASPEPEVTPEPEPEWRTNPARPNPVPTVINPTRQDDPPAAPEAPAADWVHEYLGTSAPAARQAPRTGRTAVEGGAGLAGTGSTVADEWAPTRDPEPTQALVTAPASADNPTEVWAAPEPATPAAGQTPATAGPSGQAPQVAPAGKAKRKKTRASQSAASDSDWPLDVPVPGGRLRHGRGPSLAFRYGALAAGTLVGLSTIGVVAFAAGRASVPDVPSEVDKAVAQYGISTFDEDTAHTFAGDYLRVCLRRYDQKEGKPHASEAGRMERVTTMRPGGEEDPACVSPETSTSRVVDAVDAVGKATPVDGVDNARWVTMQVSTSDGITRRYAVPVRFDDPETGKGPTIIGALGIMPNAIPGTKTDGIAPPETIDSELSQEWQDGFLAQVMQAWVASEDLDQYLTSDATPDARSGLDGAYKDVKVTEVKVLPPKSVVDNGGGLDGYTYPDGSTVQAVVSMTMTDRDDAPVGASYRASLRRNGDHWFLTDVQGGAVG